MKELANVVDTFVDSVKALNKYAKAASTKLTTLRSSIQENALAVFEAGGTWKDCVKALEDCKEVYSQQTLEKFFIKWKEQRAIAAGEKPKKQNTGRPPNPAIVAANKQAKDSLDKGYPATLAESINYGLQFAEPVIAAEIKEMHNEGNFCFVPESASDLDKQIAIANTQEATRRGMRKASEGVAKAGRDSQSLVSKFRKDAEKPAEKAKA